MTESFVDTLLTLKPGGHIRIFFATFHNSDGTGASVIRDTLKGAQHTAVVWGLDARAASQLRIEWDDGTEYREPWTFHMREHDEATCTICGIMMS